ncbi:Hypothetical_protein [Hexamita inflata]|uniref:Hypothetical_protein n=1 Tax=Hexamita inflata TaxID=28002 RepID=A0ABP1ISW8_9EUKA
MQFGGIISFINNSLTQIIGISINQNDFWQTQYIFASGYLLGKINSTETIFIQQVCIQYSINSLNSNFSQFGAIGAVDGTLTICNVNVFYYTLNGIFNEIGTIGITHSSSNIDISYFIIQWEMNNNYGINVSTLVGSQLAFNWVINHICINNSNIVGVRTGLISGQASNIGIIQNIIIVQSQTESNGTIYHAFSAAVIGFVASQSKIAFKDINIQSSNVSVFSVQLWNSHAGTIIGELQSISSVTMQNIQLYNITINTNANVSVPYSGGFVGKQLVSNNITIKESSISNSRISAIQQFNNISFSGSYIGQTYAAVYLFNTNSESILILCKADIQCWAGGIVGQFNGTTLLQANNVTIVNTNITGHALYIGAKIVGNYNAVGTLQITNSSTKGVNIINEIQVLNCLDIININSQNGC